MALGGEVNDRPGAVALEQVGDERRVADVAAHEAVARIVLDGAKVFKVARVRERVEIHDALVGVLEPTKNEIGADEAGSARNEKHGRACAKEKRGTEKRAVERRGTR